MNQRNRNMNELLDRIAFVFVVRVCGCRLPVSQTLQELYFPISGTRIPFTTTGSAARGKQRSFAPDHVPDSSPGHQSNLKADSWPYRFVFNGSRQALQLLRAAIQTASPGVFEVSDGGNQRDFKLSETNREIRARA